MIDPTRLMRGLLLALAFLIAAPFAGTGVALVGVPAALAQSQPTLISAVLFEGNSRYSDNQLLAMVSSSSGAYTPEGVERDVQSLRLAYVDAGYNDAQVTSRVEPTETGRVRVVFVVNEGIRAGVTAINFTGNEHINAGTLESVLTTKRTNFLSFLFRDDVYSEEALERDREIIRLYYANHGFPDAQVTGVAEYDATRNGYFINFTIFEGDQYSFGTIGIETSIPGLNAEALRSTIQTGEGSRYSYQDLVATADDMALEATGQGYSFADVRPRIDRDIANRTFNVVYLVDEGPRIYVERIDITGNDKTRDFVIRREFEFAEGDPFNRALVSKAKTNLEALGYFKSVSINVTSGTAVDKVVISVAVVEQSTGDYGATVGYSTQDGVLGEVSLTERNFLGRGQYLRVAVGVSQNGRTFDFSFTEPRFMGLNVSTGIDVYQRIEDETATNYYGLTTTGGQLRVGLPITRDLSATIFAGGERKIVEDALMYDHDNDSSTPEIPHPTAFNDSNIVDNGDTFLKAWVGYTLTYNGVDNVKRPTEGIYATLTQQYVGWGHNYLKTEARARYFLPMFEDSGLVASVRGQAGIINNFNAGGLHPLEAINVTPSIVRGFDWRGAGPRLTTGEYLGATMYAGISGEIEFPIPILPETYGFRGAVFADAAWVSGVPSTGTGTLDPLSVDQQLKASVGASIIWDSPFGPLRGDVAYVVSKATADRTQLFQLTLQNLL
jgi:outer membrane protein insertion porin family